MLEYMDKPVVKSGLGLTCQIDPRLLLLTKYFPNKRKIDLCCDEYMVS